MFFEGSFSHAWLSVPRDGDFRSHNQFGDHVESSDPPSGVIHTARDVLRTAATTQDIDVAQLLYARVDGIVREGALILMELELIEPFLGLERGNAVRRFAATIVDRLLDG